MELKKHCPKCGNDDLRIEKRPDGDSICANGHKFLSSKAVSKSDRMGMALSTTKAAVEANSFEKQALWKEYHEKLEWEDDTRGGPMVTVGTIDNRSVNISLLWSKLDGINVLFWFPTSQIVDYKLIEEWLKENCPRELFKDANSFHHVLAYIERYKEEKYRG